MRTRLSAPYTRSNSNWGNHAASVNSMREQINAAGRTLTKLDAARGVASPWQAPAIDRARPVLKEIASSAETVIEHINRNPKRLFVTADRLSELISDFVDYGNGKNRLSSKLELTEKQ